MNQQLLLTVHNSGGHRRLRGADFSSSPSPVGWAPLLPLHCSVTSLEMIQPFEHETKSKISSSARQGNRGKPQESRFSQAQESRVPLAFPRSLEGAPRDGGPAIVISRALGVNTTYFCPSTKTIPAGQREIPLHSRGAQDQTGEQFFLNSSVSKPAL